MAAFSAAPVTGTIPLSVSFTDQSSNNPTSWRWNFGDGIPESTQQNPSHTYSASGSYTVRLTATNASGSDDEVKSSLVQANPQPSGTVLRQFAGPMTDITGLAWDGTNLWAGDKTADRIFKLDPQNSSQLTSFSAPAGNICGLHLYSGFLYATDLVTKEAYLISTTGTFSTLFNTGVNEPMGLTFNGTNHWVTDDTTGKVFRYNLSGTLINSFASGILSPRAVEVVGTEIRIGGVGDSRIYRLDPATGTLLGTVQTSPAVSPAVSSITGMAYTGSTLWITNGTTIYETVP